MLHRTIILLLVLCSYAHAQDFMDREAMEEYQRQAYQRSCDNPENIDRWGIREPKEEEILLHGSGIMFFEYYNSPQGCSSDTHLGIWKDGIRWGTMIVSTGGEDVNHNEKITFTVEDVPYHSQGMDFLLVPDAPKPHIIVLYPLIS